MTRKLRIFLAALLAGSRPDLECQRVQHGERRRELELTRPRRVLLDVLSRPLDPNSC
jgi:hypothetical protein